jgi:hypothetical protein
MTTFKGIRGTAIQVVSSDPSNPEIGQIWYNSSSGTLKGYVNTGIGAWSSAPSLNTARRNAGYGSSSGTPTASLYFGGVDAPGASYLTASESFNGSAWTNTSSLPVAQGEQGSLGTQTAALSFGGAAPPSNNATYSWNGTSWTSVPATLNTARTQIIGVGTQTAGLAIFGNPDTGATEKYNGTTWTSTGSGNTARRDAGAFGTQTAAIAIGGAIGPAVSNATESFNGTSWTSVNNLPASGRGYNAAGTQTAGLYFGYNANPGATATTGFWNGTAWSNQPSSSNLGTGRFSSGASGSQTAALIYGGNNGTTAVASTESWVYPVIATKTITVS